jgi:hypothetical protein
MEGAASSLDPAIYDLYGGAPCQHSVCRDATPIDVCAMPVAWTPMPKTKLEWPAQVGISTLLEQSATMPGNQSLTPTQLE